MAYSTGLFLVTDTAAAATNDFYLVVARRPISRHSPRRAGSEKDDAPGVPASNGSKRKKPRTITVKRAAIAFPNALSKSF